MMMARNACRKAVAPRWSLTGIGQLCARLADMHRQLPSRHGHRHDHAPRYGSVLNRKVLAVPYETSSDQRHQLQSP